MKQRRLMTVDESARYGNEQERAGFIGNMPTRGVYWLIDSLVGLLQFISVVYPFSLPICGTALRELPHAPNHGVSDEQKTALLICSSRHTRTEYSVHIGMAGSLHTGRQPPR